MILDDNPQAQVCHLLHEQLFDFSHLTVQVVFKLDLVA